ncbi:MAG: leucine-rich repeat domain-containing protein [Marinifilaceae bacterium]|nr:leucine-rich repeat domain-containing protein [Marinifilaceae bacterium]
MKKLFSLFVLLLLSGALYAQDLVVTLNGQKVYFNILSEKDKSVGVTYFGSITDDVQSEYSGEISLPSKIRHNGEIYNVVSIGSKAFSGADKLTGIVIPMGITKIGAFAFEGCTSLSKIVFPSNNIEIGEGAFFKCPNIQHITLGGEWNEINLAVFRWSDKLESITIPAKVTKVINAKKLMHLKEINVDVNNNYFASIDGLLYDKCGETLYCCPRAYSGNVVLNSSTKVVTPGALSDCYGVSKVVLSDSLETLSFREFARLKSLNEIEFKGVMPVMTALDASGECFLLQVANQDLIITVPKGSLKLYKKSLIQKPGEYKEIGGDIPYLVNQDALPSVKSMYGIK